MAMKFPTMSSITNAAKASGLAVYRVRQLCKEGRIKFLLWPPHISQHGFAGHVSERG